MEQERSNLTKEEATSLKSRWDETDPDGEGTVLFHMVKRLKTECKKHNSQRSLNLDLRGITILHENLSDLDLSGYDLSYANLNRTNLKGAIFTRSKLVDSDFKHSNVNGTNFELDDMQGGRLLGIKNFKKAKWIGADITGLDLRGAYLDRRYIADITKNQKPYFVGL